MMSKVALWVTGFEVFERSMATESALLRLTFGLRVWISMVSDDVRCGAFASQVVEVVYDFQQERAPLGGIKANLDSDDNPSK